MSREAQDPTTDDHGAETHPAFGMINVARVTASPPQSLFDSELKHSHYLVLSIHPATRQRDLNRDWIHDSSRSLIEVAMSEAQWAHMVSSLNNAGTPVTITRTPEGQVPAIPYAPRLAHSVAEVKGAARQVFDHAREALETYEAHKTVKNLRALRAALESAESNVAFAANSMTEHAENVVAKARADIEAMVDDRARQLGIDPHTATVLELGTLGEDQ